MRVAALFSLVVAASAARLPAGRSLSQIAPVEVPNWALLLAGSNGWGNYRHQADVAHAYQTLISKGMAPERIVTMMYDDLAQNSENPYPGQLFNHPDLKQDVYAGLVIDYAGDDVTADNFYAVLTGNASALKGVGSGKVIGSTEAEHIFIFYSDHGGPGIICAPVGPYIYADDLNKVLAGMSAANQYDKMTIYVEACESGSIFEGILEEDLNIYVLTASNAVESSWGYYCPGMTPSPPPEFSTCLGDLFSIAWMEDSDAADTTVETLAEQAASVVDRTSNGGTYDEGSHVMSYGTMSFLNQPVSNFIGQQMTFPIVASNGANTAPGGAVAQRDADLHYLYVRYQRAAQGSPAQSAAWAELQKEINLRDSFDKAFQHLATSVTAAVNSPLTAATAFTTRPEAGKAVVEDWQCYRESIAAFTASCGAVPQPMIKHFRVLTNFCNAGIKAADVALHASQACAAVGLSAQ